MHTLGFAVWHITPSQLKPVPQSTRGHNELLQTGITLLGINAPGC